MQNEADGLAHTRDQARIALLQAIASSDHLLENARAVSELAEAYAWITSPDQSHGGGSTAAS